MITKLLFVMTVRGDRWNAAASARCSQRIYRVYENDNFQWERKFTFT